MAGEIEKKVDVEEGAPSAPAAPVGSEDVIPKILPVLPLSDVVLFPSMVAPLVVTTAKSIRLIDSVVSGTRFLITVLQRNRAAQDDEVSLGDLYEFGCVARLIKMLKFPDETVRILVQGISRCHISRPEDNKHFLEAHYLSLTDEVEDSVEVSALLRNASQRFQEIITLSPALPEELKIAVFNIEDPGKLTDLIASHLNMTLEERQALLEDYRPKSRLNRLATLLNRELEVLRLGTEIQHKVSETFSKTQREFFLREQMKAIKQELGEKDQQAVDVQEIDQKIAKAKMPPDAQEAAKKERDRLMTIPTASPEYAVVRTYLDWLTELPWTTTTEDMLDIRKARKILDHDHFDLKKIKDRILEFLSVLKLKKDLKGPILCFMGPPGVGKTSLGQSIARALGRKFVRMSLGGMRDEAEIRGHRRTYIGALPGRIIQGLRKAGTRNPVFMLDEIDKLGVDFRGDPAAALLEVLDPEQNSSFTDHYLNVPFDLSSVLFITTGNMVDTIPIALRDRMEILELPGMKGVQVAFEREAIEHIVADYTREAGVRNLDREIANICRKIARGVAEGKAGKVVVTPQKLHGFLGHKVFESEVAERVTDPGVATGLAWTPTGGDILFIEATQMTGRGSLILTGSLGDVMKESAHAALSYIRANSRKLKLDKNFARQTDFHIHVPAGAIPKDGPSAGLAMVVALMSLVTQRPVAGDVAMTGEITLRGKVMPVGGIKEKVLAAARAGIRRVVLPKRNERNLEDLPPEVRRKLQFIFVRNVGEALHYVLSESAAKNGKPGKKTKD